MDAITFNHFDLPPKKSNYMYSTQEKGKQDENIRNLILKYWKSGKLQKCIYIWKKKRVIVKSHPLIIFNHTHTHTHTHTNTHTIHTHKHACMYALYLGSMLARIIHLCCWGTLVQFNALSTIAPASIKPKPKWWLTGRQHSKIYKKQTFINIRTTHT